jgi:SAM-dependent methyltransferase
MAECHDGAIMNKLLMPLKRIYHALAPNLRYLKGYRAALKDLGDADEELSQLFRDLIAQSKGKQCLQIGVMNGAKLAPHWIAVDLFDTSPLIDFNYDVHDLKFPDASFDIVVCTAVLEHVQWPQKAVHELGRVLRPGGLILVGLPWVQPFHEMPKDYWRASPDGLRVWMSEFTEIRCACVAQEKSALYTSVFFYGKKEA